MATHHDIRFEELGIFKVTGSWGWGRGTQKSSELQNKKCDRVLKSRELICVWKDFIWNTWTKEITFQRGVSSLHVCLDSRQPPRTQSSPALAPGVSREGMKRKQLEMETRIWMRFVAKAKHSVPTDLNFLCLFPGLGSLLKLTPLPSLLLPDGPMEWRGFREVKVKRGTIWCPLIVFSLAVPRGDSRKWNCSFGPTSLSDILFIKAWHLDLLSCGMLSVAVASHLGCGFHTGLPNLSLCCVVCWASPQLLCQWRTSSSDQRKRLERGQVQPIPVPSQYGGSHPGGQPLC